MLNYDRAIVLIADVIDQHRPEDPDDFQGNDVAGNTLPVKIVMRLRNAGLLVDKNLDLV